jgi:exodeoxyribonuclease VII large subunit
MTPDDLPPIITVTELNRMARTALEKNLPSCWVVGEISNLSRPGSGHWYFTLKDAHASVRCAMFKGRNQFVDWLPRDGERVEMRVQATLYEAKGDYQLLVDAMRHTGQGSLFEAFLRLKDKLHKEGLFASAKKRPLPLYPRRIGIVTSRQAAALHDVLTTLGRRWPSADVILYPSRVQGEGAGEEIAAAIGRADEHQGCEVLLLVRGGGSLEDLRAFNEEVVARAIAACRIPTIAGIGHETDFTIADFVADMRAPTPTGAAQLATPDVQELQPYAKQVVSRLTQSLLRQLNMHGQRLDGLGHRLKHPAERIAMHRMRNQHLRQRLLHAFSGSHRRTEQQLISLFGRLRLERPEFKTANHQIAQLLGGCQSAMHRRLEKVGERILKLESNLQHLGPAAVLDRGYSIVRDETGTVIRTARTVACGQSVSVQLSTGGFAAEVTRVDG